MRQGASRVFFDVMIRYQTARLIKDVKAQQVMLRAATLDTLAGIGDSMQGLVDITNAWTSQMVTLGIETGLARVEFEKFFSVMEDARMVEDQIISMGAGYGFGAEEALSAGARMAQLSTMFGPEAVPMGTQLGMTFGMIGGMQNEDAMKKMIQLQQQTNFMMGDFNQQQFAVLSAGEKLKIMHEETIRVMDALNSVENTSVAIMSQITDVMNNFAAQAHLTGESIENMAAQSALLIEAGEEQGKAGRALRMIYARLGGNISGAADTLGQYVDVMDESTNTMRPLSEIMADLAPQWEAFSAAEKQAIAQSVSGNRHYVRFIKLMENHERLLNLQKNAYDRLFPAEEERDRKLQDTAMSVKVLNTELENQERLLSEHMLPALEEQLKIRLEYRKVIVSLMDEEGTGIAGIVSGVARASIVVSEYLRIWSGWFNVYTGILSAKIGLEAYGLVMRSMSANLGDFYNIQSSGMALNIAMSETEINQGYIKYQQLVAREQNLEKIKNLEEARRNLLAQESVQQEAINKQVEKAAFNQEILNNKEKEKLVRAKAYADAIGQGSSELRIQLELDRAINAMKTKGYNLSKLQTYEDQAQTTYDKAKAKLLRVETTHLKMNVDLEKQRKAVLQENLVKLVGKKAYQDMEKEGMKTKAHILDKITETQKQQIAQAEHKLDLAAGELVAAKSIAMAEEGAAQAKTKLAAAQDIVNTHITEMLGLAEPLNVTLDMLTLNEQDLAAALHQEAIAQGRVNDEKAKAAAATAAHNLKVLEASKASKKGAGGMKDFSSATMGFNVALMGTNLALRRFLNDTEQAQAQVLTMSLTMAAMVFEMGRFAYQMAAAAKATRAFMVWTGIGAAVAIAAVAAVKWGNVMPKIADETEDIEAGMSSISLSFDKIVALSEKYGDETATGTQARIDEMRSQVEAMQESMKNADKDMKQAYQERIDELENEIVQNSRLLEIKRAQLHNDQLTAQQNEEMVDILIAAANAVRNPISDPNAGFLGLDTSIEAFDSAADTIIFYRKMIESGRLELEDVVSDLDKLDADRRSSGTHIRQLLDPDVYMGTMYEGDEGVRRRLEQLAGDRGFLGELRSMDADFLDNITDVNATVTQLVTKDWQEAYQYILDSGVESTVALGLVLNAALQFDGTAIEYGITNPIREAVGLMQDFENTRDELFFGGRTAALTGSLYRQVIQQGVGTLYNHQEVIVSSTNNFHGFFSIDEAARKIGDAIDAHLEGRSLRVALGG